MKLKTSKEILAEYNQRMENADDKGLEMSKLTQELTQAIATEQGDEILKQAREMVAKGLTPEESGCRALSKDENTFYDNITKRILKQSIDGPIDTLLPRTTVNKVFEDLTQEHELLKHVDIAPAGLKKFVVGSAENIAVWGNITDSLKGEIIGDVSEINLDTHKLTAYLVIPKGIVELGNAWIDKFIRTIIKEAMYEGLEYGIICGTGKDMPIGMMKDLDNSINGEYVDKTPVEITSFEPFEYLNAIAGLTKGGKRVVKNLLMIVNPVDHLTKVLPAMLYKTTDGEYVKALPYPTTIVQSTSVPEGRAILGESKRYFLGASAVKVELYKETYADSDLDLYTGKLYGNARPKDNDSFVVLDIEELSTFVETIAQAVTQEVAENLADINDDN